jgi:hypothetical protein
MLSAGALESFDPAVFRGDDRVPRYVCNLALTLALIYNDCKDVLYWNSDLLESHPELPARNERHNWPPVSDNGGACP